MGYGLIGLTLVLSLVITGSALMVLYLTAYLLWILLGWWILWLLAAPLIMIVMGAIVSKLGERL
jgi:hypothetical protein